MLNGKLWLCNDISDSKVKRLSSEAGISKLLARVFLNRGIEDGVYIKKFLNTSLDDLHDPLLLKDMDKAVERITRAVASGEKICIYGDYDVDGVTSTSILLDFLRNAGADADFYIPDRMDEGYGLSIQAADRLINAGVRLVVTVDCGISAVDETAYLKTAGVEVVITDHHQCRELLPDGCAVVNPCRPDSGYPFRELAGVGVTYKLICALSRQLGTCDVKTRYLELVTLGTIADVASLSGENRAIAKAGLKMMENTRNPGLKMLIEVLGLKGKALSAVNVGFIIAPRINAAGRIGDAGRAVKLFTTADEDEARSIVEALNEENRYRQETESAIFKEALGIIEAEMDPEKEKVLVICGSGWHHGVIGIVASRISEKFYRPVILLSNEDGICKGSGRSVEGFNLFNALSSCSELLERYGGHELAAGLSLSIDNLQEFRRKINLYADSVVDEAILIPKVRLDAYIDRNDISIDNILELEKLSPFGAGNQEPLFAYKGLKVSDLRTVGDNKHLKLRLEDKGVYFDAIAFRMGERSDSYQTEDLLDIAFTLEINTWNSAKSVQLNVRDIKPAQDTIVRNNYFYNLDKCIEPQHLKDYNIDIGGFRPELNELVLERSDLAAVYQYVKANCTDELVIEDLFVFAKKVAGSYNINMNYFKLKKSLEIFEELSLLTTRPLGKYGVSVMVRQGVKGKARLENSPLYRKLQSLKNSWQDLEAK